MDTVEFGQFTRRLADSLQQRDLAPGQHGNRHLVEYAVFTPEDVPIVRK